jgi:hypothetical protein
VARGVEFCEVQERTLNGKTAAMWAESQDMCRRVVLNDDRDKCKWLLEKTGQFTV